MKMKKIILLVTLLMAMVIFTACQKEEKQKNEINIGYFPNISHAPAMVGIEKGIFEETLYDVKINTTSFPNGSLFMDALSTEQIDIGYVGPGPVLNRYLQGGDVVVLADASVGENVLVARKDLDIDDVKDLEGKIVATPSTGCTHDLLLRKMLQEAGIATEENGGTVKRLVQKPATMIGLFEQKQIDAAVVSEPWASLMEKQGVVKVVKDADEVPWKGDLPATVLVVRKEFLQNNPELVEKFLEGHEKSIAYINNNQEEIVDIISKDIKKTTEQEIELDIIKNSLERVRFTPELDKGILQEFADLSKELGFVEGDSSLEGLFN